jgi:hypothetical protein
MFRAKTAVPTEQKAAWAPESVWTLMRSEEKRLPLSGIKSQIIQSTPAIQTVTLRNDIKSEPVAT